MADPHEVLEESGIDRYAALTPAGKLVAQIYGVIAPHPVGVARARRIASQAGIALAEGRLGEAEIRGANRELIAAGLAMRPTRAGNEGVCATPHWAVELTRRAHADGRMQNILSAFDATRSGYGADRYTYETLLRYYLVSGAFDELDRLTGGDIEAHEWRILAEPLAADLLRTLPERYLDPALAGCLRHVVHTAADPEPVIRCCLGLTGRPERHAADIAFIRVLQGRFDEAEAVFANLPGDTRESRPGRTGLAATRGFIALLRGDSDAARLEIDAALTAEKAGTRKRNVFPDHAAFALSLLALVRLDTPESHALLDQLLRVADRQGTGHPAEVSLVADAVRAARGYGVHGYRTAAGLETLLDGFRHCWTGLHYRIGDAWLKQLGAYHDRASVNGYKWAAAECLATFHRLGELQCTDPVKLPDPQSAHAELGTRTLAVLAEPVADWERSLKALEQLAYDADRKSRQKRAASAPVEKRLAWDVVAGDYEIGLSPREQRRLKNGGWSKGRRVSLKRLASQAGSIDYLRDEDRAAAAAISARRTWNSVEHVLDAEARHLRPGGTPPHLQRAGRTRRHRPPRTRALRRGRRGRRRPGPRRPARLGRGGHLRRMVRLREPHRGDALHRRSPAAVQRGSSRWAADPPPTARRACSKRYRHWSRRCACKAPPGTWPARKRSMPTPSPGWRLEPFEAGLAAALLVEPIAGSGICFAAGQGAATVFASLDGERVQAHRDLARERSALARLIGRCPRLASNPTEYAPLVVPEPAESLELLEQLDTRRRTLQVAERPAVAHRRPALDALAFAHRKARRGMAAGFRRTRRGRRYRARPEAPVRAARSESPHALPWNSGPGNSSP